MSAPFPRWSTTALRLALLAVALVVLGTPVALWAYMRTPYVTGQWTGVTQPVQFDHRHHVGDDGIDCRYCHWTVERAPSAGFPPTALCLNCHSQIWTSSPLLEPVRASAFTGAPIPWRRVHALPDHVFFNHAIHLSKGVGCVECHGRVDRMGEVMQAATLQMGWCLDCHRAPEERLRPREFVTSMTWEPPADRRAFGQELAREYAVRHPIHCSACHR